MICYQCDSCRRRKEAGEVWILGLAAESIGVTTARREITISSAWDETRARSDLAVHFCCEQCRRDYVARLFGEVPAAEMIGEVMEFPRKRTMRAAMSQVGSVRRKSVVSKSLKPLKSKTKRKA